MRLKKTVLNFNNWSVKLKKNKNCIPPLLVEILESNQVIGAKILKKIEFLQQIKKWRIVERKLPKKSLVPMQMISLKETFNIGLIVVDYHLILMSQKTNKMVNKKRNKKQVMQTHQYISMCWGTSKNKSRSRNRSRSRCRNRNKNRAITHKHRANYQRNSKISV